MEVIGLVWETALHCLNLGYEAGAGLFDWLLVLAAGDGRELVTPLAALAPADRRRQSREFGTVQETAGFHLGISRGLDAAGRASARQTAGVDR